MKLGDLGRGVRYWFYCVGELLEGRADGNEKLIVALPFIGVVALAFVGYTTYLIALGIPSFISRAFIEPAQIIAAHLPSDAIVPASQTPPPIQWAVGIYCLFVALVAGIVKIATNSEMLHTYPKITIGGTIISFCLWLTLVAYEPIYPVSLGS